MDIKDKLSKTEIVFFVISGIFFMMPVLYSGRFGEYGLSFWGPNGHDAIFHLALIKNMGLNLNFDNPLLIKTTLQNYHLIFDLLSTIVTRLLGVSIYDWYFRISPLISTFLLFVFTRKLLVKMQYGLPDRIFSFILVLFGGSFGFLISIIKGGTPFGGESAFWINQSVSAQLNPPYVWSLVALMAFVYFYSQSKRRYLYVLVPMLLFWLKAYAGILAAGVMVVEGAYAYLKTHKPMDMLIGVVSGIFLLLAITLTTDGQSLIIFEPFWFMKNMWSAEDRLGVLRVSQWWNQWERDGNVKLVFLQLVSIFIFIVGNFGIRLFFIKSVADFGENKIVRMLWWVILLGISAPILIVQKATPWNTGQFAYYSLACAALLSGKWIYKWLFNSRRLPELTIKMLIVCMGVLTTVGTLQDYYSPTPATYIGYYEIDALSPVSKENVSTLTLPYERSLRNLYSDPKPIFAYESTAYIAMVGSKCSLCDEVNLSIMGYEYKKRLNDEKIFLGMEDSFFKEFVDNHERLMIYIPSSMVDVSLFKNNGLKLVSSNQGVSLWKK